MADDCMAFVLHVYMIPSAETTLVLPVLDFFLVPSTETTDGPCPLFSTYFPHGLLEAWLHAAIDTVEIGGHYSISLSVYRPRCD
jgi:hypothetical protein